MASEICLVINLSEQRAYLIEQGKPSLVSPIASGKPGWSTPTGNFNILRKDVDYRSGSFGSILNASGKIINGNATAASRVPAGCHYRPDAEKILRRTPCPVLVVQQDEYQHQIP